MKEESSNKIKLGAFVLVAILLLILGLYYIGSQKNIFHTTIKVKADFDNVGGLLPGNNVRFNGINVGTVSKVYAIADTLIRVEFTIDKELTKFINQYAIASIGTDGLLGNKIINVTSGKKAGLPLSEGDTLQSVNPMQIDAALRTLTKTNENLQVLTSDLKNISSKINSKNSILNLFKDSLFTENVKSTVVNLKLMSNQAVKVTGDFRDIVKGIKSGKGTIGALITDTLFSKHINQTIVKFDNISDSVALISGNISHLIKKLKQGQGSLGMLLTDTMVVHNLNKSIISIDSAAGNFDDNMKALKYTWPFKKYFKSQKKGGK